MKTFNNLNQINKYYNKDTNTYEFVEDGKPIDIELTFDLPRGHERYSSNILAKTIKGLDISAVNIEADEITACEIYARHICCKGKIDVFSIHARSVTCTEIYAIDNEIEVNRILAAK